MQKIKPIILILLTFLSSALYGEPGTITLEISPRESFDVNAQEECEIIFTGGKGSLRVGAESLDENTEITVQPVEITYDESKFSRMGNVHRFGPKGLEFKKPVQLTLSYKEPEEFPEEFINIYYFNASEDSWQMMEKVNQDFEFNTITVSINHFSDYAPGVGSYSIEEGMSPNSCYFRNNSEFVDRYSGNLIIGRNDLNISGQVIFVCVIPVL